MHKLNPNLNQHSSLRTAHAYHCTQLSYTTQNSSDNLPSHHPDITAQMMSTVGEAVKVK